MNTKKAVFSMMSENTGSHFLDSGGAYGRHWQRNQEIGFESMDNSPKMNWRPHIITPFDPKYPAYLELDITKSLYHHLHDTLEYDEAATNLYYRFWAIYDPEYDLDEDDRIRKFAKLAKKFRKGNRVVEIGDFYGGESLHGYTYNDENILDQDFIYDAYGSYVFIRTHNGCDARGGFSDPKIFKINDFDTHFLNYSQYILGCEEGHYWDFDGGYENDHHEDCEEWKSYSFVDYDDLEDGEKVLFDNGGTMIVPEEQQTIPGFEDVRKFIPYNPEGTIIIKDGKMYCPVCGKEMYVDAF